MYVIRVFMYAGVCMKGTRLTRSAPLLVASRCWVAVVPLGFNVYSRDGQFS